MIYKKISAKNPSIKQVWSLIVAFMCLFCGVAGAQSGNTFFKGTVSDTCNSSAAGDIDGDGVDELVVGSIASGKVFVYNSLLQTGTIISPDSSEEFGTSICVSDLDGDGVDEILVGAPKSGGGTVYIYDGITLALLKSIPVPTTSSGVALNVIPSRFGKSISTTPDMNNNGFAEVLIGAPASTDAAGVPRGLVTIVDGQHDSIPNSGVPMTILQNFTPAGVPMAAAMVRFGAQVEGGDFDGDGVGDVAVYWRSLSWAIAAGSSIPGTVFGEPNDDARFETSVDVSLGFNFWKAHLVTVYRLDGGPLPLHVLTSRLDDVSLTPYVANPPVLDMANAGDLDGDGVDDLIIGDSLAREYMGPPTPYGRVLFWLPKYADGNVDMSKGKIAENTVGGERLGRAVASLGDINGDFYTDSVSVSTEGLQLNSGGAFDKLLFASDMGEIEPEYVGDYAATALNFDYAGRLESGDFDGDGHKDIAFIYRSIVYVGNGVYDESTKIDMYSFYSESKSLYSPVVELPADGGIIPLFLNCDANTVGNKVFFVAASQVATRGIMLEDPCGTGLLLPFNTTDSNVILSLAHPTRFFSTNDLTVPSDLKLKTWMEFPGGPPQDISVAFFTYDHLDPNLCWTAASNVYTFHLN